MPELLDSIASSISDATGRPFRIERRRAVGGGCISEAWLIEGGSQRYFVKTGKHSFEQEAAGLDAIGQALKTPDVICLGTASGISWLVLECVDMNGPARFDLLGKQLAALHGITALEFGLAQDNLIGSTPQINSATSDWIEFWKTRRLGFQFELARKKGHAFRESGRLLENLDGFFSDYGPVPSLLHGDLWRGNAGFAPSGIPVLFDPAVYYGDREADIAMTELFGGFPPAFYASYNEALPLDPGYGKRKKLYNLYHILNHFNLFGGSYLGQAQSMTYELLAEAC